MTGPEHRSFHGRAKSVTHRIALMQVDTQIQADIAGKACVESLTI
jgi:hypothetical protein